jgi:preprotein translocase subunit SecD
MKRQLLSLIMSVVILIGLCSCITINQGLPAPPSASSAPPKTPTSTAAVSPIIVFGEQASESETAKWTNELGRWKPATAVIDGETKTLSSRYFKKNTMVGRTSQTSGVYLTFEWTEEGAQLSKIITGRLVGKPLGIFTGDKSLRTIDGYPIAPTVNETITDKGQITGLSPEDATALSRLLNES